MNQTVSARLFSKGKIMKLLKKGKGENAQEEIEHTCSVR